MNRDLLERAINKEDAALTEIYTEYYGMLRNSILYLLKNGHWELTVVYCRCQEEHFVVCCCGIVR